MRKPGLVMKFGIAIALALALALPTPGLIAAARAEIAVATGDYCGYAKNGERSVRSISFAITGLDKMSGLASAVVRPVEGQTLSRPLDRTDYVFDSRNAALMIHNEKGFLRSLPLGEYRLDMTFSPWGGVTATFFVFEKDTLQIQTQPQTVLSNIGDDVTFTCRATGTSPLSYQWQRKSRTGWKNIKGATARIMTISAAPEELQGYTFRCVAATNFASATSDEVKLYMIGAGDDTPLWLYGMLALAAAAGLLAGVFGARRCSQRKGNRCLPRP